MHMLKRDNSKTLLPKPFRNMILKLRRNETTFNQI